MGRERFELSITTVCSINICESGILTGFPEFFFEFTRLPALLIYFRELYKKPLQ